MAIIADPAGASLGIMTPGRRDWPSGQGHRPDPGADVYAPIAFAQISHGGRRVW